MVFSCNASIVRLLGSFAVFVQTLASASVVYCKEENDGVAKGTASLNEQRRSTTHKTTTDHQGMQVWGLGDKIDRDTSLGCASRPRGGRMRQSQNSLHEAHGLHHRSIVARMGTSIGSQWQESHYRFQTGSRHQVSRRNTFQGRKRNETHSTVLQLDEARLNGRPFGYR
jgi:hypothetical protein